MEALLVLLAVTPGALGRVRIVAPDEVAARLADVTVLDAREPGEVRSGHIPGSRRVDWKDWTLEKPGFLSSVMGHAARWGKVPAAGRALEERLSILGLSNARPIVVVGKPGGWGEEGRIAWNLLYWGADDVSLLDGGVPAWRAAGHAVETGEAGTPIRGNFVLAPRPPRRIDLDGMKAALESRRPVLDARTVAEYAGEKMRGQKRGGHLPGAPLVPEKALYAPDGRYVDAAELRRLTGLSPGSPSPAIYCVGGVRSALLALLLEARLGILAANYDGSMWEWASRPDLPLVTGAMP